MHMHMHMQMQMHFNVRLGAYHACDMSLADLLQWRASGSSPHNVRVYAAACMEAGTCTPFDQSHGISAILYDMGPLIM